MAQKQYAFDFVLNAMLNGGFSSTFSKAQQEFIKLGNEIKDLQALQRDIASYQKQAAAVENTTKKLDNLRRQYELVNKQIQDATGSTAALEREKLKLEQRITNTQTALEKQRAKLEGTKERLDAAGVSTGNLAAKDAELTESIKKLTEEQEKAAEEAKRFGTTGSEAFEVVGDALVAAGIVNGLGQIKNAFTECVQIAADFEEQMSAVEAIANANDSQMEALAAEAKELGATTIYTAQQSAEGMKYMAMAGWTAEDMLNGMQGMTTLAAAAGEDLGMVSDIVTDSLTAFGLKASDTAHFADVLAQAANKSNTDIAIMGDTFKYSAAVAGALGYSIEDVATMIGLMANSGIKGSRAGTSLRNIFNGLLGDITLTARAFGEVEYSAVNADGTMKGLAETVSDLRYYFSQMTESEQVANALDIAQMYGYNGLLAIINSSEADFNSLYDSINNCTGAAERMAKVKLDNLNGDVTLMNSAMEALQSTIGEQFNPELRELAQIGTEGLNWMNELIQLNPSLAKGVMVGAGAFGTMATAIVGVNAAIQIFKKLNLASLFTGLPGTLLAVAAGIGAVATVGVALYDELRDGGRAVRELTEAAREMDAAIEEEKGTLEDTVASTIAAADVADSYIDRLEELGDVSKLSAEEQQEYQNTLALLLEVMPSLSDCISTTTDEYGRATYTLETTTAALRENTKAWKENAKAQAYQDYLTSLMEQYNGVMVEQAKNQVGLTKAKSDLKKATEEQEAAEARMAVLWQEASEKAEQMSREYGILGDAEGYVSQEYRDLESSMEGLRQNVAAAQADVTAHEKALEKDAQAVANAEEEIEFAKDAFDDLTGAMGDNTGEQEAAAEAQRDLQTILNDTSSSLELLADKYDVAYAAAKESIEGQFGLFDLAQADAESTVAAAQKALDSQLSYWTNYAQNVATLREISAEDLGVTQENYQALMDYVRDGTPEAAGLAQSMVNAVKTGKTQVLTELANTLGEVKKQQEAAETDIAEWTIDLEKQVNEMVEAVKEDVGNLELSEEAKQAAMLTIQALIDQANAMEGDVARAYRRVADAMSIGLGTMAPAAASGGTGMLIPTTSTKTGGSILPAPAAANTLKTLYGYEIYGFARGTENAPPGWSWVGEEGPELMRLHGGEQILPAAVSRELAESYRIYNQYTAAQGVQEMRPPLEVTGNGYAATAGLGKLDVHFHIAAGAGPETVDAWQDYARRGELKAAILEVMEGINADMRRRALT